MEAIAPSIFPAGAFPPFRSTCNGRLLERGRQRRSHATVRQWLVAATSDRQLAGAGGRRLGERGDGTIVISAKREKNPH
jgi:hypothetical protein